MADNEYERLRRAIEQQYTAGLELLREGYEAKLRALEKLAPAPEKDRRETLALEGTTAVETQTDPQIPLEAQGVTLPVTQTLASETRPSGVMYDILDVFPRLPQVFDRRDIADLLGYMPSRTAVHRATSRLIDALKIAMVEAGEGRRPSKYCKLKPE